MLVCLARVDGEGLAVKIPDTLYFCRAEAKEKVDECSIDSLLVPDRRYIDPGNIFSGECSDASKSCV